MSIIEGIPKTWSYINFDEVQLVPIRKKVKQSACIAEGALPVVDQGQDLVGGYTNDVSMRVECELPVIVFGDRTKVVKYIDFDFAAGADGIKILKPTGIFDSKFFYYQLLGSRLAD